MASPRPSWLQPDDFAQHRRPDDDPGRQFSPRLQLSELSNTQIDALTTTNILQLTSTQANALTSTQVQTFTAQLRSPAYLTVSS